VIYAELGKKEEARAFMAEALKRRPGFSLDFLKGYHPYKNPAHLQRQLDAHRKAGMLEKAPSAVP